MMNRIIGPPIGPAAASAATKPSTALVDDPEPRRARRVVRSRAEQLVALQDVERLGVHQALDAGQLRRHVDVLTGAGALRVPEGHEGVHGRFGAGVEEQLVARHPQRRPVDITRQPQLAGGGGDGEVGGRPAGVGAGAPERRDGRDHQRRVARQQRLVPDAPGVEPPGGERLDDDVGVVDELEEAGTVGGVVEVEHDRRLPAVLEPPRQVLLDVRPRRIGEQTLRPTGITTRRLDLDDRPRPGRRAAGRTASRARP